MNNAGNVEVKFFEDYSEDVLPIVVYINFHIIYYSNQIYMKEKKKEFVYCIQYIVYIIISVNFDLVPTL